MTGLSHKQARQLMHLAADKCLNPGDRAVLEAHLQDCAGCRAYASELTVLDAAIARALKVRWAAPRRSPIDISARVRRRMWREAERAFVSTLAQFAVKLGSLASIAALAAAVLRAGSLPVAMPAQVVALPAAELRNSLPAFEFESDGAAGASIVGRNGEDETWVLPTPSPNGLRVISY